MPVLERVKWKPERRGQFVEWIRSELVSTQGDRAALDRKWSEEIVQWRAALPKTAKEFPWPGASNVIFPLTAMRSDPVYADFMQTLHAAPNYWHMTANRADRTDYANSLTEFAGHVDRRFLNMRQVNSRALLDNNILGTAIYKNHWLHERKKVRDYDSEDRQSRKIIERVKVKSHPFIEPVPLQHFWIPADAWDIDPDAPIGGARWVAQEVYLTASQLKVRAQGESPHYPTYNAEAVGHVLNFETHRQNSVDDAIRRQEQFQPFNELRIRVFEVWARYDVDGDGVDEDVFSIVHYESGQELRTLYMPFLHGGRPFHRTRYLPTFGFYGLGLAEADRWAQLTATKLLNAIVDNVMVANTKMYSAPIGSGIQPGEPIYPGKIWLHAPGEKVEALSMGEVYPSIFNTLGSVLQYSELRDGVNELRSGNLSGLPSRTPATSLLSILREGNKRFDMILSDFRRVHDKMGLQMMQNVAQWYQEDPMRWEQFCVDSIGEEDAAKVIEVFGGSVHEFPEQFGVTVSATSAMVNKEVEKQAFVGLLQLLGDLYPKLVETAGVLQQTQPGTPVYETAAAAYMSGVELMGQLLQKFDIQNPREYLGNLESIAASLQATGAGANAAAPMMGMQPPMGGMAPSPQMGQFDPALLNQANIGQLLGF